MKYFFTFLLSYADTNALSLSSPRRPYLAFTTKMTRKIHREPLHNWHALENGPCAAEADAR